jgi:hypothetical protein
VYNCPNFRLTLQVLEVNVFIANYYIFLSATTTPFVVGVLSLTNGATVTGGTSLQTAGAPGFNLMYAQAAC